MKFYLNYLKKYKKMITPTNNEEVVNINKFFVK